MDNSSALTKKLNPDTRKRLKQLVLDSVAAKESKRAYARAIDNFLDWFESNRPSTGFTKATVQTYRALLIGCGLRRDEAARLDFEHIQERQKRWLVLDLRGKGGRIRSVPMPSFAKEAIDEWTAAAGLRAGRIFRSTNRGGKVVGDKMS